MGQALYRKYRSKKLSEVVGQEHITTTLENALKKGVISHAYLFTGPRGVGKTSVARILAHEVNDLSYDGSTHLDIIEIDAASNRRIDEIRDLREHVHSAPTSGKYKVYIIDEVHMLTKEAFNALLKTLEEPPAHVIFILATTESHKLPETIISRTQHFTFKPFEHDQAVEHLRFIAKSEKVEVDDEALTLIAHHGQGSFRDSISLLDQVSSGREKVQASDVRSALGIAPDTAIDSLLTALEVGSASVVLQTLEDLRANGYHTPGLAKQLAKILRRQLLTESGVLPRTRITQLLKQLIDVPASHDPDTLLEIILISNLPEHEPKEQQLDTLNSPPINKPSVLTVQEPEQPVGVEQLSEPQTVILTKEEGILDEATWQEALQAIKKHHNTLYSVARMASPTFSDDTVTLTFAFPFHLKRLDEAKNKKVIGDILTKLMDTPVSIVCVLDQPNKSAPKREAKKSNSKDLDTISNIFGGAEMLE
ncbi:DNA polymerase III subunit gamma/tau [Candidatus Saccharibacteria bacterium]|nr:DNA polymerase III subunit gamma/tau [Candidatus Saccharibacteria bacterium]